MDYVVTLVHGTFARDATWIRKESALSDRLSELLDGSVLTAPFQWTGNNSMEARQAAALELQDHLRSLLDDWPTAKHVVVGHSHGGNVALYALRDEKLESEIVGVACLATPFLVARPRRLGPFGFEHLFVMGLLVLAIIGGAVGALLGQWLDQLVTFSPAIGFAAALVAVATWMIVLPRWRAWAWDVVEQLALPPLENTSLLIARPIGDEASSSLSGVQAFGWAVTRVWTKLSNRSGRFLEGSPVRKVVLFYPATLLRLASGLLLIPIWLLLSGLSHVAFGRQLALAGPFAEITVEVSPPGEWSVYSYRPVVQFDDQMRRVDSLDHSTAYSDPQALEMLVRWIQEL